MKCKICIKCGKCFVQPFMIQQSFGQITKSGVKVPTTCELDLMYSCTQVEGCEFNGYCFYQEQVQDKVEE